MLENQLFKPIEFTKKEFFHFSYDFKSFLSSLLIKDWGVRLSAFQALIHPWLNHKLPTLTFKKLTKEVVNRTKTTNQSITRINIDLLNCLVSVARGTDKKFIKRRAHSVAFKNSLLRVSKTK